MRPRRVERTGWPLSGAPPSPAAFFGCRGGRTAGAARKRALPLDPAGEPKKEELVSERDARGGFAFVSAPVPRRGDVLASRNASRPRAGRLFLVPGFPSLARCGRRRSPRDDLGGGRMTDPSMSLPHDIRTPGRVSSRRGLHWEEAGNSQGGNAAASLAVTRLLPVSSWVAVERVRAACYCFLPTQRVPRLGGGTDESPGESPGRASWPAVEALRLHRGFSPEISDAPAERSVGHDGVSIDSSTARSRPSQAVDLVGFQSRAAAALPGFP